MQVPLQITFRHMPTSPALEERVRALAARLDKFSPQIVHCHVVIEEPHRHHQQGERFDVRIELSVPGRTILVGRSKPENGAHEDPYVALRDAFRAARRKLQEYERERRHEVKTHAEIAHGRICEIDADRGFGRIETPDGRFIYFHRNSVRDCPFGKLTTGAEVRFAEEPGDLGPQASTVHVID